MREPAVRRGAVPVLHSRRNVHHVAGLQRPGGFAFLLVPTAPGHADQDLAAAAFRVMDVPVVAAPRLEGHVEHPHLAAGKGRKIAFANKVLGVGVVGRADGKHHLALVAGFFVAASFRPDLLRHAESRPCLGPAGVEGCMGKNFGYFGAGDTVLLRGREMVAEGLVHQPLGHQRHHRDQRAVPQAEGVLSAPHFPEKHIVVQTGEFRSELPQ